MPTYWAAGDQGKLSDNANKFVAHASDVLKACAEKRHQTHSLADLLNGDTQVPSVGYMRTNDMGNRQAVKAMATTSARRASI